MKSIITTFVFILSLLSEFSCSAIDLIWQVDRAKYWEEDWLKELTSGIPLNTIDDKKYEIYRDRSIIVIGSNLSANEQSRLEQYFARLTKKKYKFGIIHLSDEYYTAPTHYYKDAQFVFRTFWHAKFKAEKNVTCIALGYKNGFWKNGKVTIPTVAERDFTWSFAGQLINKPTRQQMIESMKGVPNGHIHETFTWNDPNALSVDQYRDLLLNTIFVPCGTGWVNLDTYRLYESLECGCIPIVENQPFDYFHEFLGENPFITVSSWDDAPDILNGLLSDPKKLEELQVRCSKWWENYKETLHQKFLKSIRPLASKRPVKEHICSQQ